MTNKWKAVRLGDLDIEWKRGSGLRKSDIIENGTHFCVHYGELYTLHHARRIDTTVISKTNTQVGLVSKKGDVLVPGTSTAAKSKMLVAREVVHDGVLIGSDVNVIRSSPKVFASGFLPYFFESNSAYQQMEHYITGSTGIIHISMAGLKELVVPVPPIEEQREIVAVLDSAFAKIDAALANVRQNIINTDELFQSKLKQIFSNAESGWQTKTIGEIGKVSMCKRILKHQTLPTGDIPFYKIGTFGKSPNAYIDNMTYENYKNKYSFPKKGDILISASGTIGRRVVYDGMPAYFQDSNIVWVDNSEKDVLNEYLYYFYGYCDWNPSRGATISRLYNDDLRRISINFPNKDEQINIVKMLKQLSDDSSLLRKKYISEKEMLLELKKSLLQEAFSGNLLNYMV